MATPITPLTEEQLQWFADAEAHAVRTAVKRVQQRALVGFLILLVGIGGNFYVNSTDANDQRDAIVNSGKAIAVDGCNRDFKRDTLDIDNWVSLFNRLLVASEASKTTTPEQKAAAAEFYNSEIDKKLAQLNKRPDCRNAATVLTSDPDAPVRVPEPLYP